MVLRIVIQLIFFTLLVGCKSAPPLSTIELTYIGTYTAVENSNDPLTCYCRNGGYIDTCDRQHLALCFEGEAPPGDCQNIEIWGYLVREAIAENESAHCEAVEVRYLMVERWVCKD